MNSVLRWNLVLFFTAKYFFSTKLVYWDKVSYLPGILQVAYATYSPRAWDLAVSVYSEQGLHIPATMPSYFYMHKYVT